MYILFIFQKPKNHDDFIDIHKMRDEDLPKSWQSCLKMDERMWWAWRSRQEMKTKEEEEEENKYLRIIEKMMLIELGIKVNSRSAVITVNAPHINKSEIIFPISNIRAFLFSLFSYWKSPVLSAAEIRKERETYTCHKQTQNLEIFHKSLHFARLHHRKHRLGYVQCMPPIVTEVCERKKGKIVSFSWRRMNWLCHIFNNFWRKKI